MADSGNFDADLERGRDCFCCRCFFGVVVFEDDFEFIWSDEVIQMDRGPQKGHLTGASLRLFSCLLLHFVIFLRFNTSVTYRLLKYDVELLIR